MADLFDDEPAFEDEEEEAGDEEEEEDDEDEDQGRGGGMDADEEAAFAAAGRKRKRAQGGKRKRKKRPERTTLASFYDDEADEGNDDDEEVSQRHQDRQDDELEAQRLAIIAEQDRRREREKNRLRADNVAEIAANLEQRYATTRHIRETVEEGGQAIMENEVARQFLLPTRQDPKLFLVACKRGQEANIVLQLMSKAMAEAREGHDIGIQSAMNTGSKERFFVEGRSEPAVKAALTGINHVYLRKIKLVPLGQMTEVLNVARRAKKPLQGGQWVRMKRGVYKGDLAKVVEMLDGGSRALVQLVPRLDLSLMGLNAIERRAKSTGRPPQRLFSAAEVQKMPQGRIYLSRKDIDGTRNFGDGQKFDFYENNYYDSNGFLLKSVPLATLSEDAEPRLEELLMFKGDKAAQFEEDDGKIFSGFGESSAMSKLALAAGLNSSRKADAGAAAMFSQGDRVRAVSGDLENLVGTVSKIDPVSQLVSVRADNKDITMNVAFQPEQLVKLIAPGDHVKILDGRYTGETGTVVSVDRLEGEEVALIVSDLSYGRQMAVSLSALKITPEVAQGLNRLQGYEVNDLVALGQNEVGVVINILREQVVVLDTTNDVREFRPEELRGKLNHMSVRRHGLGADRVALRQGDQILVEKGPEKRRSGTILHIYRNKLFIHDKHRTANAGIFTAKAAECRLFGQSRSKASINDMLGQPMKRMPSKTQDMRGKSVRIRKGKLKGFVGIIVEENDETVKVELHARAQKVTLNKKLVKIEGDANGALRRRGGARGTGPGLGATPGPDMLGSTPNLGVTPALHGGQTPAIGMGVGVGVTPMVDAMSSSTPGYWQLPSTDQMDTAGSGANPYAGDDGWGSTGDSTPISNTPLSSDLPSDVSTHTPTSIHTPTSEYSVSGSAHEPTWIKPGVVARNKSSGVEGRIMAHDGGTVTLASDDGATHHVSVDQVEKVTPRLQDEVIVVGGPHDGIRGKLIEIDEKDTGCLEMPNTTGFFKLVPVALLFKTM